MKPPSDKMLEVISLLRKHGKMRAGDLGGEMWGGRLHCCRDENIAATCYVRPMTKLLYRAEKAGLVKWEQHGRTRLWSAV